MGFLEPVVARIPLPEAQDRLRDLLERKWPTELPSGRRRLTRRGLIGRVSLAEPSPKRNASGCSLPA